MSLKKLIVDRNGIGFLGIGAIFMLIFFIGGSIMMYFMMEMIMKNIIPIAIAIILILCLPKAIDAWKESKTSPKKPGGD